MDKRFMAVVALLLLVSAGTARADPITIQWERRHVLVVAHVNDPKATTGRAQSRMGRTR